MIPTILRILKRIIPNRLFTFFRPAYHFALALSGAIRYGFPSRHIVVIGVTGTKGKSSTVEMLTAILESAGKKTAVLGTIRFKIGEKETRNLFKMTMPGRFFVQKFISDAHKAGCTHAIIEMTSEGAKQFRHRFIAMDALIFTNLAPEHIESHGSFERYREAKLSIGRALGSSSKPKKFMVANADDQESGRFLSLHGITPVPFSLSNGKPYTLEPRQTTFTYRGAPITLHVPGMFHLSNALGAAACAEALGFSIEHIKKGLEHIGSIPGRAEEIRSKAPFRVIVDYAHTPESLEAIYMATSAPRICVLGNTGGGRDKWKRPKMGAIADEYCEHIILTNEDPYDEDPRAILAMMEEGITKQKPQVILDRTAAIKKALTMAQTTPKSTVLITGKGTDPFIMGPNGEKTPWDDRDVTRELLENLGYAPATQNEA